MIVLIWLWGVVKSVLNAFAKAIAFVLLLIGILVGVGVVIGDGLPANMVLELDLRRTIDDKSAPDLLDLGRSRPSIMDIVMGLDAAARDPRVKGVLVRVGSADLSIPKAEELHDALKRFRDGGKFVIAHSQSFYSGGLGDFLAAAAADQIWMQPVSTFFSSGQASTTMFFKGLFDKIEAVPQFVQRYEYKNAANVFTETDFTPAHREATMKVLQSWYDSAILEIAADRGLSRENLVTTLNESPVGAEKVKDAGLITNIGYDEDARATARAKAGEGARITRFDRYLRATAASRSTAGSGARIALVHAAGDIIEGDDSDSLAPTSSAISGDTFSKAIRDAAADRSIRAIVLRIDSPGGSAIASDQILNAVKQARAAGKPIVVSMGSVAASGGYYIAVGANRIVAEPGTLTGSIGVLWGKVAIGKSLEKIGLNDRELGVGKNALFLSGVSPWDDRQLAKVNEQADLVYADFTGKVAEERNMALGRVEEVAKGRVWTGADAKERGLVDDLGGFWVAVEDAKRLAKIAPEARVSFKTYPAAEGLFGRLSRLIDGSGAMLRAVQGLNALLQSEPVKALSQVARSMTEDGIEMRATGLPAQ